MVASLITGCLTIVVYAGNTLLQHTSTQLHIMFSTSPAPKPTLYTLSYSLEHSDVFFHCRYTSWFECQFCLFHIRG